MLEKTQARPEILLLRAQVLYKLGQYRQAVDCYEQVLATGIDDLGDIATNLIACSAN